MKRKICLRNSALKIDAVPGLKLNQGFELRQYDSAE